MAGPGRRTVRTRHVSETDSGMNQTAVEWLENEFDRIWNEFGIMYVIEEKPELVHYAVRTPQYHSPPLMMVKSQTGMVGES